LLVSNEEALIYQNYDDNQQHCAHVTMHWFIRSFCQFYFRIQSGQGIQMQWNLRNGPTLY
jgi:hypothetical protein